MSFRCSSIVIPVYDLINSYRAIIICFDSVLVNTAPIPRHINATRCFVEGSKTHHQLVFVLGIQILDIQDTLVQLHFEWYYKITVIARN